MAKSPDDSEDRLAIIPMCLSRGDMKKLLRDGQLDLGICESDEADAFSGRLVSVASDKNGGIARFVVRGMRKRLTIATAKSKTRKLL